MTSFYVEFEDFSGVVVSVEEEFSGEKTRVSIKRGVFFCLRCLTERGCLHTNAAYIYTRRSKVDAGIQRQS